MMRRGGSENDSEAIPISESEAACRGWMALNDEIIAGIHHTFNNRLGTLSAVLQVLESEIPPDHPLRGAFSDELGKLGDAVDLLASLRRAAESEPTPLQLSDILPAVFDLYDQHHDVRDIERKIGDASGLPPVLASPIALMRSLLLLLVDVGRRLRAAGGGILEIEFGGDQQFLEILITSTPAGDAILPEPEYPAVTQWAAEMGGEIMRMEGEVQILRLRMPTLLEVRRREREA